MKACYSIRLEVGQVAIADLIDHSPFGKIITRINVPYIYRGTGVGSRLLKMITDDADKEGVSLFLEIQPYGEMTYDDLAAWYGRHGFVGLGLWERKPKEKNNVEA